MFDNVNQKNISAGKNNHSPINSQNGFNSSVKNNIPAQQGADIKKPVEDIFSDTDAKAMDGKPKVFQSKEKEAADFSKETLRSRQKIDVKKYLALSAIAFGVFVFVFAGYWAYGFFTKADSVDLKNLSENAGQDENKQNTEPRQDEYKETEKVPEQQVQLKDSDQDGLTDEEETKLGTNPDSVDSDDDGLFDRQEVKVYKTDPLNADTDGDGYLDGEEVKGGYNPNGPGMLFQR